MLNLHERGHQNVHVRVDLDHEPHYLGLDISSASTKQQDQKSERRDACEIQDMNVNASCDMH